MPPAGPPTPDPEASRLVERYFASSGRRAEQAFHEMMALFCPQEATDFLRRMTGPDHQDRHGLLHHTAHFGLYPDTVPQPYRRHSHGDDVAFYSDGGNPAHKTLLVCFGGLGGRFGLPRAALLQQIDARRFDVVMLRDPKQARFAEGAGAFAATFVDLIHAIDSTFAPKRYRRVVALGNSMGAPAAVHYAVLAGAERAVAIGAQPPADARQLIQGRPAPPAFDPLCECLGHKPLRGIWLHGRNAIQDRRGAERLYALAGGQRLAVRDFGGHNALNQFWEWGEFQRLLRLLLDSDLPRSRTDRAPEILIGPRLVSRLKRRARPGIWAVRRFLARCLRAPRWLARRVARR